MPFTFDISLNDILKSAVYASINGGAVFLSVRYLGRVVDKIEKDKDAKRCGVKRRKPNGKDQ